MEVLRDLSRRYPRRESALLPALDIARRGGGGTLARDDVRTVARLLGIPAGKAWGAATFYSLLRTDPVGRYHLQVDTSVPALLAGADGVVASLEAKLGVPRGGTTADGLFTLSAVEDLGAADLCPAVRVNDTLHGRLTAAGAEALVDDLVRGREPMPELRPHHRSSCAMMLRNFDVGNSRDFDVARSRGGYRALEEARRIGPAAVIEAVERSGLRGRGGAAFPTARKWRSLPGDDRPVYLICNADEGEQGTFKDRRIMEADPHLLVEGIGIAAAAVGARRAFVYVRGEYVGAAAAVEAAAAQAAEAGLLEGLAITVHRGAGSYVCGEETALISSLEGGRAEPRPRPPYPTGHGLYGSPTIVNNVETLAALPLAIAERGDSFRRVTPVLFSLSGHVACPGLYEYPLGTPLTTLIEAAGGVTGSLKAVIVGGLSSSILRAEEAHGLTLDYDSCRRAGTSLGSGAIIVMNGNVAMPSVALRAARFFASESCGRCVPCREGCLAAAAILGRLAGGAGEAGDVDRVAELCRSFGPAALCPGGKSFASALEAMATGFREEFLPSRGPAGNQPG